MRRLKTTSKSGLLKMRTIWKWEFSLASMRDSNATYHTRYCGEHKDINDVLPLPPKLPVERIGNMRRERDAG